MKALVVVGTFLISGALSCFGQAVDEPNTFFKESIGLNDDQIADIQHGKAVVKVLSTQTPTEVAIFGAVYIHATVEDYLKAAQNISSLRGSPNYLAIEEFSTPPKLDDLKGFVLDEDDIKDLKNYRPGKCELQLPGESMETFRTSVNWSAPDAPVQVNSLALEQLATKLKEEPRAKAS